MENKNIKTPNQYFNANAVIERGYAIYDEWSNRKLSSRKIIIYVKRNFALVTSQKTTLAYIEALSTLFALEMRVKERYSSILKCFIHYFSWRRESRVLKQLKIKFNIFEKYDIRTAIEIKLKNIDESLKEALINDEKDKIGGGKRSDVKKDDVTNAEKNQDEQTTDKENEQNDQLTDEAQKNDNKNSNDEPQNEAEIINQKNAQSNLNNEMIEKVNEPQIANNLETNIQINNQENYDLESSAESIADKPTEINPYNNAIDSDLLSDIFEHDTNEPDADVEDYEFIFAEEKTIIEDSNSENNDDIINDLNPLNLKNQEKNSESNNDTKNDEHTNDPKSKHNLENWNKEKISDKKTEEGNTSDKDSLELIEKNSKIDKVDSQVNQNNNTREPIKINILEITDNAERNNISHNLTPEDILDIHEKMHTAYREQISVDGANFNISESVQNINEEISGIIDTKLESKSIQSSGIK